MTIYYNTATNTGHSDNSEGWTMGQIKELEAAGFKIEIVYYCA